MISTILTCLALFGLGVRGQQKTVKMETILMMRSPGRVTITQADLLQSESLELAEPQMNGQILEIDFEIKKRNALQILKHRLPIDGCEDSDVFPFSFLLGASRKQRLFGGVCSLRILIVDYVNNTIWYTPKPSSFFNYSHLEDHACWKFKNRCKFKSSTFSYSTKAEFFVFSVIIFDPYDPKAEEYIGHWVFQDRIDVGLASAAFKISPIYLLDSSGSKTACNSTMFFSFFNDSSVFNLLRYCPIRASETAVSSNLEFWALPIKLISGSRPKLNSISLRLVANVTNLHSKQIDASMALLSVAMVNKYFVFFHRNYTFYFSTEQLPDISKTQLEVSSFGSDNNIETYCNRMALEVIGCTSLITLVNRGAVHYFLKFTEYSRFDGGLMQFNPVVVPITHADRQGLRLQNSIHLNHLILVQIAESKLMLVARRNIQNVKSFDFPGLTIMRMTCFQVENHLDNKLDGYIIATTRNSSAQDRSVTLRLFKVSLPYYELISHNSLEDEYCNSYLRKCRAFQLQLTTNSTAYEKSVYLIGSSFTSIIKIKEGSTIKRPFNMNEFSLNLTEYFYGLLTNSTAKVVHQLNRSAPAFIGNVDDGPEVGRKIYPADMSLQVANNNRDNDTLIWSNIVFHEDQTISVFMLTYTDSPLLSGTRVKLLHFFPSFPFEEDQITLPSSYCTLRYLNLHNKNTTNFVLLDLSKNSSTETVEFLEYDQNSTRLVLKRWSWYHNASRNLTGEGDSFTIKLRSRERVKMVRFFLEGDSAFLLILSNETIRLSQFQGKKPLRLQRLMNLTIEDLIRQRAVVLGVNDCAIHRDLLFIDLKVSITAYGQVSSMEYTRIYIMKVLPGRISAQFIGYIEQEYLERRQYHVYIMGNSRKLIFVCLKSMVLYEYSLDDGLNWIDRMDQDYSLRDVLSAGPIIPNSAMNLTGLGQPHKNLIRLWKLEQGRDDRQTLTVKRDTNLFSVAATFSQKKQKPTRQSGNDSVKYNLVFSSRSNDPLTILHLHSMSRSRFFDPIITGNPDENRMPLISIDFIRSSIHQVHLKFYETGKFMKISYQKPYFRNSLNSTALNIKFKDISDNNFVEQFNITKDYRSNIIAPKQVHHNSSTLRVHFEDLGLISGVNYGCLDDLETELIWRRELVGFDCPASKFSIDYDQPLQREGSLRLDGSRHKKVKELFPLDYQILNASNYFIILYDDELAIVQSLNHKLIYKAIIRERKLVDLSNSPTSIKLADCSKINMLWTEDHYQVKIYFRMTLFCKINGQNLEVEVFFSFPVSLLQSTDSVETKIDLKTSNWIEVNSKIWFAVVVNDEYRLTDNQVLTVITEVVIQSVGKKRIIESYYRNIDDSSTNEYTSIYSTLYDKYDSYDILSFFTAKYDCEEPSSEDSICIKYIMLKHCAELQAIKIFKERRRFNINVLNKDQTNSEATTNLIGINPKKHDGVKDGHIIYNVDENGVERIFYYLVCNDYIYEYRWNFNSTTNQHQLIARYNYLGLCSDSSYFKLDFAFGYLKVNCIPLDNDPYPNNILLFKRPEVPNSSLEKMNPSAPLNASHILTQPIGYSYLNSFHYLIESQDSKIRLIKTSPTNLVEQYQVHPFAKLHVRRNKFNPFSQPEIAVHLSNYYTEQNFTLKFNFNETNAIRNTLEVFSETLEVLILAAVYVVTLMIMLFVEKFHRVFYFSGLLYNSFVRWRQMRAIRWKLRKYKFKFVQSEAELIQSHSELESQSRQVTSQLLSDTTF